MNVELFCRYVDLNAQCRSRAHRRTESQLRRSVVQIRQSPCPNGGVSWRVMLIGRTVLPNGPSQSRKGVLRFTFSTTKTSFLFPHVQFAFWVAGRNIKRPASRQANNTSGLTSDGGWVTLSTISHPVRHGIWF